MMIAPVADKTMWGSTLPLDSQMSKAGQLNRFLASVENKAFYLARAAVGSDEDALDIVQDAMFTLARKYADRDQEQYRPLFYRILQNRITDWYRHSRTRNRMFAFLKPSAVDEGPDPVALARGPAAVEPAVRLTLDSAAAAINEQVAALPPRQQQAFLLRSLEGMTVAETAAAMKCSQGSVKTHYSRAVHTLRAKLGDYMP